MKILAVSPSSSDVLEDLPAAGAAGDRARLRRRRTARGTTYVSWTSRSSPPGDYLRLIRDWQPDAIALSCNYLANVPEVIELAKAAAALRPDAFVFAGGHSASFVARDLLEHSAGSIACVLKGEGESSVVRLLERVAARDVRGLVLVPGVVSREGDGPPPEFSKNLDDLVAARELLAHRRKYFIGVLDPCASIEFSRGCPWDCSFCSAWTFYGRSYRMKTPEAAADELAQIREPGVFIVDDVAFIQPHHGMAIGEAIARARNPEAVLPGNARRRLAAKQGGLPILEDASACSTCFSVSRRSTKRG